MTVQLKARARVRWRLIGSALVTVNEQPLVDLGELRPDQAIGRAHEALAGGCEGRIEALSTALTSVVAIMHELILWSALLSLPWLMSACVGDDGAEPSPDTAVLVPDCSLAGDFAVELGEGQARFASIPTDGQPSVHYGSQGGTHLVLAARLITPDPLDRYELALRAEVGQGSCPDGDCAAFATVGQLTDVIEGAASVQQVDAGLVEIPSLFLVVDNWAASPVRRITLELTDACDRSAAAVRTFVPDP